MALGSGDIRIRIGAAMDSSVDSVFASLEKMAHKSAKRITKTIQGAYLSGMKALPKGFAEAMKAQEAAARGASKRIRGEEERNARAARRAKEREAREAARAKERADREAERARVREARRASQQILAQRRREDRQVSAFARRTSHRATRFFWPNAPITSMARRTAGDVLRGAGVKTTAGQHVSSVVEADQMARAVSTQAYQQGVSGPAGKRVPHAVLLKEADEIAEKYRVAKMEVLAGQKAWVDQRGDLQGARDIASEMVGLFKSQNTEIEAGFKAAAKVESALSAQAKYAGDSDAQRARRLKAVSEVMRVLIQQGKVASIPLEEMAAQLPKLTGLAGMFSGDVARNIGTLASIAQQAETGAAKNPATASTYAYNLAVRYTKNKTVDAFSKMGVNVKANDGKLRNIRDIITETLVKTDKPKTAIVNGRRVERSQMQQLSALLPNIRSFLGLMQAQTIFSGAGGGQKGLDALNAYWDKQEKATSKAQIQEDLAIQMDSMASKAQDFNNKMERLVSKLLVDVVPAFEELAPIALKTAEALGGVFQWAAKNPGTAIAAALGGSIARAMVESTFRGAIEAALMRNIAGTPGGPRGAGGAAAIGGKVGAALGVIGVAAATFTITTATLSIMSAKDDDAQQRISNSINKMWSDYNAKRAAIQSGDGTDAEKAQAKQRLAQQFQKNLALTMEQGDSWLPEFLRSSTAKANRVGAAKFSAALAKDEGSSEFEDYTVSKAAKATSGVSSMGFGGFGALMGPRLEEISSSSRETRDKLAGELRVRVTNADDLRSPATGISASAQGTSER